jgi:ACS family tartrate transporter-like MFS transporter
MQGEAGVFSKAAWRLMPFLMLLYIVCYLDRVNVGFAALGMNKDLRFTPEMYSFGAGIFFLGYFVFEVPSNLMLLRVGARRWIARIMLTWGVISMATALVHTPAQFYGVRLLLGFAEAGFYPGILLYMTFWFPQAIRARFCALFLASVPLANVFGGPLSGWILGFDGAHGLHGWQWLFLLEGVPACLLAIAVLLFLPDGPSRARWLTSSERDTIATRLAAEPPRQHHALLAMLSDPRLWILALPGFGIVLASYGIGLWLPQIVKAMGYSNLETGFVVAIPFIVTVIAMVTLAISSDRRQERVWHVVIGAVTAAGGLCVAGVAGGSAVSIVALSVALAGIYTAFSIFWMLPMSMLGGAAAAGGIALINSICNLGGFAGPVLMGWLLQRTGTYSAGMFALSAELLVSAALVLLLGRGLKAAASLVPEAA